ncbi:MAG: alpha/beta hydrolase family protein [Acidimicrobiales bacterium]
MRRAVHKRRTGVRAAAVVAAALCAVAVVAIVQLTASPGHAPRVRRDVPGGGTHPTLTNPPAGPPVGTPGRYQTASASVQLTEPPTVSGMAGRELPTTLWYPAAATSGAAAGAPDVRAGPFPLVVFAQGYDISLDAYYPLLRAIASAGIVVAAPVFPHTEPTDPSGLDESDIVNHPADLRYVIGTLLGLAAQPGSVLSGLVIPGGVGLLGHSDGGDVIVAVGANSCCRDSEVKSLAVLSGAELASFGGTYFSGPAVPLLVVQGSADTINPPGCSVQIYDSAPVPKFYLDLLGASHEPPYVDAGTDQDVVVRTVVDFFASTLAGEQTRAAALAGDGTVPGASEMIIGGTAPPAAGGCPGAPA